METYKFINLDNGDILLLYGWASDCLISSIALLKIFVGDRDLDRDLDRALSPWLFNGSLSYLLVILLSLYNS